MIALKLSQRLQQAGLTGIEVSIGNRNDKTTWVLTWAEPPTPEQETLAAQIVEAFGPMQYQIADYTVECYDSLDVDRATNRAISDLLAPNSPPDLQQLRREKRMAESLALTMKATLGIVLTAQEQTLLTANLQIYAQVMALSAAGDAFKAAQGWEDTDGEDK